MKEKLKGILINILAWESRLVLEKFQPEIIAITGNVGKTTTKDFIFALLSLRFGDKVRASAKSQNSEFGVPLTILNAENAWGSFWGWLKIITFNFLKTYFGNFWGEGYPEILVLEIGADHPGDIQNLALFVKPKVVVLTAFQNIPTHGQFFKNIEEHIREKKYLAEALVEGGYLIYNSDDEIMSKVAEEIATQKRVRKYSFGKTQESQVQILESENYYNRDNLVEGTRVKFASGEYLLEIKLRGVLGEAQNYSLAGAVAVGLVLGMQPEEIKRVFAEDLWEPSKSRMRILHGVNQSTIVDDSYNASPLAVKNALETLRKTFVKGKKVLVLGYMAELGEKEREAHLEIGKLAGEIADVIIFSGKGNEHYLDGVRQTRFDLSKVYLVNNAEEVEEVVKVNKFLGENDLILIKGSQSNRLEKVVVELLSDERDTEKVCRQETEWKLRN